MSQPIKPTYTVTADDPEVGAPLIRAQMTAKGAEEEAERLRKAGFSNVKVTPVINAGGSAG